MPTSFYRDFSGGLNLQDDPRLISKRETPDCLNVFGGEDGTLKPRKGTRPIFSMGGFVGGPCTITTLVAWNPRGNTGELVVGGASAGFGGAGNTPYGGISASALGGWSPSTYNLFPVSSISGVTLSATQYVQGTDNSVCGGGGLANCAGTPATATNTLDYVMSHLPTFTLYFGRSDTTWTNTFCSPGQQQWPFLRSWFGSFHITGTLPALSSPSTSVYVLRFDRGNGVKQYHYLRGGNGEALDVVVNTPRPSGNGLVYMGKGDHYFSSCVGANLSSYAFIPDGVFTLTASAASSLFQFR